MTLTRDDITYIKGRLQSAGPAWLRLQLRLALETLEARHMVDGVEVEAREFRDHVYMVTGTKTKKAFNDWWDMQRAPRLPGPPEQRRKVVVPKVVADPNVPVGDTHFLQDNRLRGRIINGVWDCDALAEEEGDGGYVDRDPVRLPAKGELP